MLDRLLTLSNWWWKDSFISEDKSQKYHRASFENVKKLMKYRQIIILTGLRRVGKTTILFQLIEEILKEQDAKKILYFNFDEKSVEPVDVLKEYGNITGINWQKEKCYVFFDEIQKIRDWSGKIKFLYDNLPNIKLYISGSASLMIKKESVHNLTGRHFLEDINPLSLKEFAELYYGKEIDNFKLYRNEIEKIFNDFIKRPFPEIVNWDDEKRVNEYIKELVIDKVIKIDIPGIFDINTNLLNSLTEFFLTEPGVIINFTDMAKNYQVHKLTLQNHIFYLEFAKVIKIYNNFRPSIKAESRKMRKVYPYDISLSFPFYPQLEKGKIIETVFSKYFKNYWREREKEVDFIKRNGKLIPVEIKSKNKLDKSDLRNLIYFMKKYDVKEGWLIYQGENKVHKIENGEIQLINAVDFLFENQG